MEELILHQFINLKQLHVIDGSRLDTSPEKAKVTIKHRRVDSQRSEEKRKQRAFYLGGEDRKCGTYRVWSKSEESGTLGNNGRVKQSVSPNGIRYRDFSYGDQ